MLKAIPQWTQDESIAFECACECITDMRAILTAAIYDEEAKAEPDKSRLAELEIEMRKIGQERAGLHVHDHEEIARIQREYGAKIRAWRAATALISAAKDIDGCK